MTGQPWLEPLLHGAAGLGAAAGLFALAKLRFRVKGGAGAGADSGLD